MIVATGHPHRRELRVLICSSLARFDVALVIVTRGVSFEVALARFFPQIVTRRVRAFCTNQIILRLITDLAYLIGHHAAIAFIAILSAYHYSGSVLLTHDLRRFMQKALTLRVTILAVPLISKIRAFRES